jgi:hypothetical protein
LTGIAGGRPTVSPILRHFSFAMDKTKFTVRAIVCRVESVQATVEMNGALVGKYSLKDDIVGTWDKPEQSPVASAYTPQTQHTNNGTCKLRELAYARSGDKGDTANIGARAHTHTHTRVCRCDCTPFSALRALERRSNK